MRNACQTDRLANIRPILDDGHNPAVVELEKSGQHHQRKQLMLRKILAAVRAGVGRKRVFGNLDGLPGQRHRRPRHRACGFHSPCI